MKTQGRRTNAIRMPSSLLNKLPWRCSENILDEFMSDIRGDENHFRSTRGCRRCKGEPFSTATAARSVFAMMTLHLHNESAKWNFFYALALVLLLHVAQQCQALPFCCHRLHDLLDGGAIGWFTPATMKESSPGKRTQEKTSPPTFMEEVSKAFTTEEEFFPFFKTLLGHIAENKLSSKALLLNRKISSKFPRFLLFFCAPLSLLLAWIWRDGI